MHIRSLRHVIEAVIGLVHPESVTVMGSSSVLAYDPGLGEMGQPLELSLDADLLVEPMDEAGAGVIHEAVGEGSLFHRTYGAYVDLLRPEIAGTLPQGWRDRCVAVEGAAPAVAIDPHDLAVAKLAVARAKDMVLLRELLRRGLVNMSTLRQRYQDTPMTEDRMFVAGRALAALQSD